jgi:hypothetical protein
MPAVGNQEPRPYNDAASRLSKPCEARIALRANGTTEDIIAPLRPGRAVRNSPTKLIKRPAQTFFNPPSCPCGFKRMNLFERCLVFIWQLATHQHIEWRYCGALFLNIRYPSAKFIKRQPTTLFMGNRLE